MIVRAVPDTATPLVGCDPLPPELDDPDDPDELDELDDPPPEPPDVHGGTIAVWRLLLLGSTSWFCGPCEPPDDPLELPLEPWLELC